ncbi:nucleotidyltransferase domain-containing protein [Candidatus Pacearchaeota archaeon]|nr:nucleotidyltransferase domain-containing protein [Candidatus Pacearchaeota archaeon]
MDKIIEYFIREPEKVFHVRELSKLLRKSPTTISKYLKEYEKEKVLSSENKLNHLFFKANLDNQAFKDIKLNYNLSLLNKSGLIDYLDKEFDYPEAIILFGSFAKAENAKKSDIDLLIITSHKKELNLKEFEKKIGNPIQLHLYSNKDIELMKVKNKELLDNFVNGLILRGYWELFK